MRGGAGGGDRVRAGNRPLAPLVPSRLRQADSTNSFTRWAETGFVHKTVDGAIGHEGREFVLRRAVAGDDQDDIGQLPVQAQEQLHRPCRRGG